MEAYDESMRQGMVRAAVLCGVFVISLATSASAKESITVCAKEQTSSGSWSQSYKVSATYLSGSELNTATKSFNYSPISKYVVIFWDAGQASVIELDMPWLNTFSVGKSGKDQNKRPWDVYKLLSPSSICF